MGVTYNFIGEYLDNCVEEVSFNEFFFNDLISDLTDVIVVVVPFKNEEKKD